ncbi:MAG: M14 family zinc carboxypeptidase [bacterium]
MKKLLVVLCLAIALGFTQDMVVRVYVSSWSDLARISPKYNLDVAAGRYSEWYDLVVDQRGLEQVKASGLPYEITIYSLEFEKNKYRGSYCSYDEMTDSLRGMAASYPSICKIDSLPNTTYLGRWIYGIKISDNVNIEEDEPKFTLDGAHHSREWATPQAVLFFADSMIVSYGNVPEITEIVNTTEIYCWPVINVDGYDYDYPGQNMWRKNREPFGGGIGTDPNRNYGGGVCGDVDGYWGAADEGQLSHNPATSSQTFCGAFAYSGDEIWAYAAFIRAHGISTGFSLHSYGEQVMYPWGYKGSGTLDSTLYDSKGVYMAGMMNRIGGGTYTPGQSYYNPYPTCGNTRDWVYGYNKWLAGLSALFYGAEIGTSFYQSTSQLDFISRQVFKSSKYLAGFSDSLILIKDGFVAPPIIYPLGTVGANFTIYWHALNSFDNHPTHWELVELSNPTVIEDNLESGTSRWILEGFTLSTSQSHSSSHSFFSGNVNNMNHAVRALHPYLVETGDSLTFWCWYSLETNYDVAVAEVSENTKEWFCMDDRYNANSSGWIRKAYSLQDWVGKSVYFRFRCMTDGNTLQSGFYVDDISPVCLFADVNTVSSSITDTSYSFTDHAEGEYYFYARGTNAAYGWGDYSCLEKVDIVIGINESPSQTIEPRAITLSINPNPFRKITSIRFSTGHRAEGMELKIYNASGRLIRQWNYSTIRQSDQVIWDGTDHFGRLVPAGTYFVSLESTDVKYWEKVVLLK